MSGRMREDVLGGVADLGDLENGKIGKQRGSPMINPDFFTLLQDKRPRCCCSQIP